LIADTSDGICRRSNVTLHLSQKKIAHGQKEIARDHPFACPLCRQSGALRESFTGFPYL
jgi:hypothetical protein